jgi:DNA-binding transcriptional ArsR family regulator
MSTISYYLKKLTEAHVIDVNYNIDDMRLKRLSLSDRGKALLFMYENDLLFHPMVIDK